MKKLSFIGMIAGLMVFFGSCDKNNEKGEESTSGKVIIQFEHYADGAPLVYDSMMYVNEAGNHYEVTEIQWFISDIVLKNKDGDTLLLDKDDFAHYVDTNLPDTWVWEIQDDIPATEYQSISMTFGIKGEKNKPYMFTDPPESDMLWPYPLGGDEGGYHYMKLNGFWVNTNNERQPFNFHLGVGQERDGEGNIIGFIQNWFESELPSSAFTLSDSETKVITIRMDVENWWKDPNTYDHNIHGSKIMQNQEAMRMGCENGRNVFSIGSITTKPVP